MQSGTHRTLSAPQAHRSPPPPSQHTSHHLEYLQHRVHNFPRPLVTLHALQLHRTLSSYVARSPAIPAHRARPLAPRRTEHNLYRVAPQCTAHCTTLLRWACGHWVFLNFHLVRTDPTLENKMQRAPRAPELHTSTSARLQRASRVPELDTSMLLRLHAYRAR